MTTSQRIAGYMGLEAASLAAMSALHLTGTLAGGAKPFQASHAGLAEALICVALTGGAIAQARGRPPGRSIATAALAFAILGFLVGLSFTVRGGDTIGVAYHATVLPLLLVTLVLLVLDRRRRGAPAPRRPFPR